MSTPAADAPVNKESRITAAYNTLIEEPTFYAIVFGCFFLGLVAGIGTVLYYKKKRREKDFAGGQFGDESSPSSNTEYDSDDDSDLSSSDDEENNPKKEINIVSPEEIDNMEEKDIPPPLSQEELEKSLAAEMKSGLMSSMSKMIRTSLVGAATFEEGAHDDLDDFLAAGGSEEEETIIDIKPSSKTKVAPQQPKREDLDAFMDNEDNDDKGGDDLMNELKQGKESEKISKKISEKKEKEEEEDDLMNDLKADKARTPEEVADLESTPELPELEPKPEPELEPEPELTEEEQVASDEKLVEEYSPPSNADDAWEEVQDEEGETYYYNTVTEESQWEPPLGFECKGQASTPDPEQDIDADADADQDPGSTTNGETNEEQQGLSQREMYIMERKRLQQERQEKKRRRKARKLNESLIEQMHNLKHLVKGREAKKLVKKLEKQAARQAHFENAMKKRRMDKAGKVDKNSMSYQIENARDIERTKKKMDAHYKSIEDKQKEIQRKADAQHDRLYARLQGRGSMAQAPITKPKEIEDHLFDRSHEEEGLEKDLKLFEKGATRQKAKKGGLGFGLKVNNKKKDAIIRSLHRHEAAECEDIKAALRIYCVPPLNKVTKKEKKEGKTEGSPGHPLHSPIFGLQRALKRQGFEDLPPPLLKTAIQIATGQDLNASRLSTLIIEIHKLAEEKYRGTPVCRWEDFLHWIGVETFAEIKARMPKPERGKKGKKGQKTPAYKPKKFKKAKGNNMYAMDDGKKKKRRRK
jgi:hypothetical protein